MKPKEPSTKHKVRSTKYRLILPPSYFILHPCFVLRHLRGGEHSLTSEFAEYPRKQAAHSLRRSVRTPPRQSMPLKAPPPPVWWSFRWRCAPVFILDPYFPLPVDPSANRMPGKSIRIARQVNGDRRRESLPPVFSKPKFLISRRLT